MDDSPAAVISSEEILDGLQRLSAALALREKGQVELTLDETEKLDSALDKMQQHVEREEAIPETENLLEDLEVQVSNALADLSQQDRNIFMRTLIGVVKTLWERTVSAQKKETQSVNP